MKSLAPPAWKPVSLLGYHRLLSPTAAVRVSPLCLGTMNFGERWRNLTGECSKDTAFAILDRFYEQGGNFIDTANNYQGEETETWLGEWIQQRDNRDELVLATKFTSDYRSHPGASGKIKSNYQGNHAKSIRLSVDASLKKLQTTYIDLLYCHWWDSTTSIPELMQSLHNLVVSGKVLYLGISDTPAWVVVKCNEYARSHGMTTFSVYQGRWSAAFRDFEREILPMCRSEGLALAPWGALGQGQFRSAEEYNKEDREGRQGGPQLESSRRVGEKLAELAERKGTLPTSIALAYVMHKAPYVFPIVGGRKLEHLEGNIQALSVELSTEDIECIESAQPFDIGFPLNFLFGALYNSSATSSDLPFLTNTTKLESVPHVQPIQPKQGARHFYGDA